MSEPCGLAGPCADLDSFMRRTHPHYYDGHVVWGSMRMPVCIFCDTSLPAVVLDRWDFTRYAAPSNEEAKLPQMREWEGEEDE